METRIFELKCGKYEIEFEYRKGTMGSYYEPPDPSEIDVLTVKTIFGDELTDDDFYDNDDLYNELLDKVEDLYYEEQGQFLVDQMD